MNKKDLAKENAIKAKENAIKAKENAIYFKDGNFPNMPLYQEKDIEAAFNAGRESVVDNIPDLKWETLKDKSLRASIPFGCYFIDKNEYGFDDYIISSPSGKIETTFGKQNAIQLANEDYKQRIKQVL